MFFYDSCGLKRYRSLQISGNVATFIHRMNHRSLEERTVRYCTPIAWLYIWTSPHIIYIDCKISNFRYLWKNNEIYTGLLLICTNDFFLNTKLAANSRCFFCFVLGFFSENFKPGHSNIRPDASSHLNL